MDTFDVRADMVLSSFWTLGLVNPVFARTYDSLFGEGSFEKAEARDWSWYGRKRPYAMAMRNGEEEEFNEDSIESSEEE